MSVTVTPQSVVVTATIDNNTVTTSVETTPNVEVTTQGGTTVVTAMQGAAGLSAYQVALANGFVGTQAQWLASLQGSTTGGTWGSITGTLSNQTDLQNALDSMNLAIASKADSSALAAKANIAGATFTGAISASNLSGTNTGDQTITLTGDVTGSGTGSFATAIGANKVTRSMLAATAAAGILGATAAGNVSDLTPAQVTALLNTFTTTLKGLVPASGGGTASFLRADGTWVAPSWGAISGTLSSQSDLQSALNDKLGLAGGTVNGSGNYAQVQVRVIGQSGVWMESMTSGSRVGFSNAVGDSAFYISAPTSSASSTDLSFIPTTGNGFTGFNFTGALKQSGNQVWHAGNLTQFGTSAAGYVPASGGGTTNFLRADGTWTAPPGGGGSGTVTSVSVTTANGVSGTVATATTTPAITLSLGAITPTSVAASGAVSGSNLSGTNTGDQTITLTGPVTGSGTGSFATTIAAGAVGLSQMANVATGTLFYRKTAASGAPEVQTLATLKTDLGLTGTNSGDQTITLTGDVTGSGTGSFAASIGANKVTLAQMAQVATGTFLGRTTAATGNVEAMTVAQATALLNALVGATGTVAGTKGLVPAPSTANFTANAYLKADGTWSQPAYSQISGTPALATVATSGSAADLTGTLAAARLPAFSGDVSSTAGTATLAIGANKVTRSMLAATAGAAILGATAAGNVADLTGTQTTALLDTFTTSLKGLAPASGGGTANFLRADGTWAAPVGSGTTTNALTINNGGAGAASGSTFNGSSAVTLSYNSIGAAPTASPVFTGGISVTGAATSSSLYTAKLTSGSNFANTTPSATVLTASATGTTTFDGTALAANDIVLLTAQSNAQENGVYKVTTAGTTGVATVLTRVAELNTWANIALGCKVTVTNGTTFADTLWLCTADTGGTLGTTAINYKNAAFNGDAMTPSSVAATGTVTGSNLSGTNTGDQTITLTGDVTGSGTGSFATAIGANKVTRGMLAATSGAAILGATAAGNVSDLTGTQVTALLNTFTTALKGLVPASGGGTTTYLRADGTWATPAGGTAGGMAWAPVTASGTGASQNVTIPESGLAATDILVFLNGILQIPTTDYTVSGTTVTLTTDSSGDEIQILKPAGTVSNAWGSITGTLSNQTDLNTALAAKAALTGAAFTGSVSTTGTISATNKVDGWSYNVTGATVANERYVLGIAQYALSISAGNSVAKSLVAATASTVFTIYKGTVASPTTIGTFTFGAGATSASVSITAGSVSSGDMLWIGAPATPDSTLADMAFVVRA